MSWVAVDPTQAPGERSRWFATFAEAIAAVDPRPAPEYPPGEQPPIATVRALLQAAWD